MMKDDKKVGRDEGMMDSRSGSGMTEGEDGPLPYGRGSLGEKQSAFSTQ